MRATAAALRRIRETRPSIRLACGLFLIASIAVAARGRDERSGWTLMTSPTGHDHRSNTLLGYCWLRDGRPFMKENIPCTSQVGLFAGSLEALARAEYRDDFRLIRGFYSFAASFWAPFIGIVPSLLAVNWLSWAACAVVAYKLTLEVSGDDTAALLAVLLVTGGTGPAIHIGDYSPHLLAFASYYAGVWLLVRTAVHQARRPFTVHLGLGLYFALSCLAYNTGVMLVAVYFAAAAFRNRWLHLAAAALIALSARPMWQALLGSDVPDVEAQYLGRALESWREVLLTGDLTTAIKTVLRFASEFLFFFDSPAVVVAGLASCLLVPIPWPLHRLGLAAVAMPFLAAFVFAPAAGARGYLVYAGTIWIYCCLAMVLAMGLRRTRGRVKPLAAAAVVLLLASHLLWSTAHLWNQLGPIKSYFLGWDDGLPYFAEPTEVISMTGHEPTPVLFGGDVSLVEAGATTGPPDRPLKDGQVTFGVSLLTRGFFVAYMVGLAAVSAQTLRRRLAIGAAILGSLIATAVAAPFFLRSVPAFFPVDQAVVIPARGEMRYEVALAPRVTKRLTTMVDRDDTLGFYFRISQPCTIEVSMLAAGRPLSVTQDPDPFYTGFYRFESRDRDEGVAALSRSEGLLLTIRNLGEQPVTLSGWQRTDLPSREVAVSNALGAPADPVRALPAFELRLSDRNGHLKLAAF